MKYSTPVSPAESILKSAFILPAALFAGTGAWAAGGNVCSKTANTLLTACGADTNDNYFVSVATCKNLADADESAHNGEFKCNHTCLETRDYTALEPDANEHKFYAPGVGLMLEADLTNGARNELVSYSHP